MKNIPKVPIIIGVIFVLALVVVIVTTIALKKSELIFRVTQLEGKYTDRTGATFVGSETCKSCHERTYLEWRTSLHSRMMRDVKVEPLANIGDFRAPNEMVEISRFSPPNTMYLLGIGSPISRMSREKETGSMSVRDAMQPA